MTNNTSISTPDAPTSAPCSCCSKHTHRPDSDRKKLINRLNAAVNSFNKELLANHIRTCVARDIREGKDETIDELVTTLQKLMK